MTYSELLKTVHVGRYEIELWDDDPYYFVDVKVKGERYNTHLLARESEFEELVEKHYKN